LWNDDLHQTTSTASGLAAGAVRVYVTDNNQCTSTGFAFVTSSINPLQITLLDSSSVITSCPGNSDGSIYLNLQGEVPFAVNSPWMADSNFVRITNVSAGTYPLHISDNDGCDWDTVFIITAPDSLRAFTTSNPVSCPGCTDGSLVISSSGGSAPYTVSYHPAQGVLTGNTIHDLSAGIYTVCITDKEGCSSCVTDTVIENPQGIGSLTHNGLLTVYPNPFSSFIDVDVRGSEGGKITVSDIAGSVIKRQPVIHSNCRLDFTALGDGVYLLKYVNDKGVVTGIKKLIRLQ
jgi:hypothetical protein